jgi:hypothetical protein
MTVALYMDHMVQAAITNGPRRRGVDVLTCREDGTTRLSDRAAALSRLLFTRDRDVLTDGTLRQAAAERFAGIAYARQRVVSIADCIESPEPIAKAFEPEETQDNIYYLPL